LEDVFVPDELLIGQPGQGWEQNTTELIYERGGPDRWLSTYVVIDAPSFANGSLPMSACLRQSECWAQGYGPSDSYPWPWPV
jgi:hypothetical protein